MARLVTDMNKLNLFTSSSKKSSNPFLVIFKFIIFWLILAVFFFSEITPQYLYGYNASIIDKVSRLQSIHDPKIILIGNSNVAFGFRSDLLENAFDMPVVNMGLHGGFGNAFHEQMAKINLQEGDIVVVCHSEFNDDDTISDPVLAWSTVENHFSLWKDLIRPKDYFSMANSFSIYLKKCIELYISETGNLVDDTSSYSRFAFNEYGDNVYSDTHPGQFTFTPDLITVPQISDACVERLNELNEFITDKGATLLIAGYPIADCAYTPNKEEYDTFESELRSKLNAPVISHYQDYFFPESDFYNSHLHLNSEGAKKRTYQLIDDLQTYFNLVD